MSGAVRAVAIVATAFLVSGCEPEPLTPERTQRLESIYVDMGQSAGIRVVQNLRYAGLYEGETEAAWSPALAEAINKAHFAVDSLEGRYDLNTDSGASGFLDTLSTAAIRRELAEGIGIELAKFKQVRPPAMQAVMEGGTCYVSAGAYSRHGEQLELAFYRTPGRQAGLTMMWDGLVGPAFPRLLAVTFGQESLLMNSEYRTAPPMADINLFNTNGHWVVNAIKQADRIAFEDRDIGIVDLPTGDLYRTGLALDGCFTSAVPPEIDGDEADE